MSGLLSEVKVKTKIAGLVVGMILVAVITIGLVYYFQSLQKGDTNVVNLAGRQRMLSQKIAFKAASIIAGQEEREELKKTVELYDKSLKTLRTGGTAMGVEIPPAPRKMFSELSACDSAWQGYQQKADIMIKHQLKNENNFAASQFVALNNEKLLRISNEVVTAYVNLKNSGKYAHEIDVAGRQRMLSQKISKHAAALAVKNSPREREKLLASVNTFEGSLKALIHGGTAKGENLKPAPAPVQKKLDRVSDLWEKFYKMALIIQREKQHNIEVEEAFEYIKNNAASILKLNHKLTLRFAEIGMDKIDNLKTLLLLMLLINLVLGMIGYYLAKSIAAPITRASEITREIARGNLRVADMEVLGQDETGVMAISLNEMKKNLSVVVGKILSSSSSVYRGAESIFSATKEDSRRSQEQAASLEETAATLEQITANVKMNASNSSQANSMAQNTVQIASAGESVVRKTIDSMAEVTESSNKIANIIEVVNDISFQTNLLALNAAVEAARAGEQGRGFAVVAGEVRTLAGKSAEAAKQIKTLIQDSRAKVGVGNKLVAETGNKLSDIISEVKALADIVSEITAASQEQAIGIEEINKAVTQMDRLVQSNTALIEESTANAEKLSTDASELEQCVSTFEVADRYKGGQTGMNLLNPGRAAEKSAKHKPSVNKKNTVKPPPSPGPSKESSDIEIDGFEEF